MEQSIQYQRQQFFQKELGGDYDVFAIEVREGDDEQYGVQIGGAKYGIWRMNYYYQCFVNPLRIVKHRAGEGLDQPLGPAPPTVAKKITTILVKAKLLGLIP